MRPPQTKAMGSSEANGMSHHDDKGQCHSRLVNKLTKETLLNRREIPIRHRPERDERRDQCCHRKEP